VSGTTTIGSLCSADLPSASAFYNRTSGNGYNGRIFMNGEEVGAEGRAFAFVATGADAGKAYELPKLGKFSRENSLANPLTGDKTVVIGTDDSTPGQVYVYVGTKQASGNSVERAGLTNGTLSGIKVSGITLEKKADHDTSGVSGGFTTVAIDTTVSGAAQQTAAATAGVTEFARPEDGAWVDADTFVFVTTGTTNGGSSKLYKVDFADDTFSHGTVSMVLNSADLTGTDGQSARSFDNITVGLDGNIYIQEDPGDSPYIAKTWQVDLTNPNAAVQIFESDQARFLTPTPPFSQNEEHSGIIDVTDLFAGASWYVPGTKVFLADTQAHYAIGGELVEGGQLSLLTYSASAFP
jgi:nitrous oxide reductase accessory protein NosL